MGRMASAFTQQRDPKASLHILASVPTVWMRFGRHGGGCGTTCMGHPWLFPGYKLTRQQEDWREIGQMLTWLTSRPITQPWQE